MFRNYCASARETELPCREVNDVEKVRKENAEKMQARRQDKIDFVEEKERKAMEKKKAKKQI